jgi:hypothetical protein
MATRTRQMRSREAVPPPRAPGPRVRSDTRPSHASNCSNPDECRPERSHNCPLAVKWLDRRSDRARRHRLKIKYKIICIGNFCVPLVIGAFTRLQSCHSGSPRSARGRRGHRTRITVPREQEQRHARWERCMELCRVFAQVRHGCKQALLLSSGGGGSTSKLSVFVSASPTKVWFSAFSAPKTLSALGVVPVIS